MVFVREIRRVAAVAHCLCEVSRDADPSLWAHTTYIRVSQSFRWTPEGNEVRRRKGNRQISGSLASCAAEHRISTETARPDKACRGANRISTRTYFET